MKFKVESGEGRVQLQPPNCQKISEVTVGRIGIEDE